MKDKSVSIYNADCLKGLPDIESSTIDMVATDPPYGIGFMGKDWDRALPDKRVWAECLRVLKPGAFAFVMCIPRADCLSRMIISLEDAGFDVSFTPMYWAYASGFPKAQNIGKQVDKKGYNPRGWVEFAKAYKRLVTESEFTHNDIDKFLGIKASSCYWARTDNRGGMPPQHHWDKIKGFLSIGNEYDELYKEAEREVIGKGIDRKSVV